MRQSTHTQPLIPFPDLGEAVKVLKLNCMVLENAKLIKENSRLREENKKLSEKIREYNRISRIKK